MPTAMLSELGMGEPFPRTLIPLGALPAAERKATPSFLGVAMGLYLIGVVVFSQTEYLSYLVQGMAILISTVWFGWSLATARRIVLPRPVLWFGVWVFWASVTIPLCPETEPFNPSWATTLKVCLMTFIASQCVRTRGDLLFCFLSLVAAGAVVFAVDADSVLRAVRYERYQNIAISRANDTLLANANTLALFALLVIVGAAACFLGYRSKLLKGTVLLLVPFGFYLFAASGSRKGMASIVVVAFGLYWFHFRKTARTTLRSAVMLVVGVALVLGTVAFVLSLPTSKRLTRTMDAGAFEKESRWVWFQRGLQITLENPFMGIGIEGFSRTGASGKFGTYSHSTITEVLTATGIPGFALYFGSQASLFVLLWRLRRSPLGTRDMAVVNCCMIVLCVWGLYEVFAVMFNDKLGWPLLGCVCGYCWNLRKFHGGTSDALGSALQG